MSLRTLHSVAHSGKLKMALLNGQCAKHKIAKLGSSYLKVLDAKLE